MNKHFVLSVYVALANTTPALAERLTKETQRGLELSAPIGGVIWQKTSSDGVMGVTIHTSIQANWGSAENVDLPEGSNLIVIREKKLKACRRQTATTLGGVTVGGWRDCAIDKDGDGKFELISFNEVAGAKSIASPVPYSRGIVPIIGGASQTFRQSISYLGKSGSDIRLSYREFSNDIARPAFTEDLTLPAPIQFPQTMLVKDIKVTVLGIDGSGMRYRLDVQ